MMAIAESPSGAMAAMRTCWLAEWLVRTIHIDRPHGSGQIAVAFESGADLILADGSVRNNKLGISVSTMVIDESILRVCQRALCGLYVLGIQSVIAQIAGY